MHILLMFYIVECLQMAAVKPNVNEAWIHGPNGLKIFFGRKGGTIRIYREQPSIALFNDPRPPLRSGQITFSFGRIQEVDESANSVSDYHGVKNLNNVEFTISHHKNTQVYTGSIAGGDRIRGDCMSCQTSLKDVNDAKMIVLVCAVTYNQTIMIDNEQLEMYPGLAKFFVYLLNWPWSDGGKYVEMDFIITVPSGRTVRRKVGLGSNYPIAFELGADATANFTSKINIDGNFKDMDHGYPKLSNNGGISTVTLRLPRFSLSAFYDPTVDPDYEAYDLRESDGAYIQTSISAICAALVTCFTVVY